MTRATLVAVPCRLPKADADKIKQIARTEFRTPSQVIRMFVAAALTQREKRQRSTTRRA